VSGPRREPCSAEHMIEVLRDDLFALPSFALLANVRSAVGADVPGLRIADAVAVDTRQGPGLSIHGIECKRTRGDLAAELADPRKAAEIGRFCETFSLVVPAPWKNLFGSRLQLPPAWGLIEVDGRRATRLVHPTPRRAEAPPPGFLKALLRSAATHAQREATGEGEAPARRIVAHLSRDLVVLGPCMHRALRPLAKRATSVACFACAAGEPSHADAVEAALEAADPATLERYRARVDALLGVRMSGPALASCPAPAPELAAAAAGGA
jgi:hypothetical protein